jgi:AmmeMemoRadiSam system protein B
MDGELRDALVRELGAEPDRYRDNTVEVLLPMVKFFFPRAKLVWLRLPPAAASFAAGRTIAEISGNLNRRCVFLGSTDLTHYGAAYGFAPRGGGREALEWVTKVNDRAFIDGVLAGDPGETLGRAERDRSACSAGAVLGALGFAEGMGAGPARLLDYGTSADTGEGVPDSFVGYAAFAWYR